jgi:alanine racemase
MKETYRCWAEIDRAALRHNARVVRDRIGSAEMLAVVKANAYGHGLVGVAETLADEAQLFGVANLQEALTLRESLPHPIVILGPAMPEERPIIAEHRFIPTISSLEEAQAFDCFKPVSVNFKIDTGMGRMGVVQNEAREVFQRVAAMANIEIHSISTHMPVSNEDAEYTRDQLVRFQTIVDQIRAEVPGSYKAHVLQSAGTLAFNQTTHEIVRAGIMLYGISPLPEFRELLKPVMTWKTRICLVRDVPKGSSISYGRTFIAPQNMRVATLSAGYADGYPWHLSNRGAAVLVRGKRCPLLGRVTMDLIVIDVSGLDNVQVGDDVVLMGRDGTEEIPCSELAEKGGTITWEIVTRIGVRVRRVYLENLWSLLFALGSGRNDRSDESALNSMFQIVFNELSAAEISALPKKLQLELLAEFQILPEDLDQLDSERFGVIEREGKKLYRYRAKNYRIYFAKTDEGIKVHRVLHKNTLRDLLFRSKLPVSEDAQLGETREFWKLIEEGERTPKA